MKKEAFRGISRYRSLLISKSSLRQKFPDKLSCKAGIAELRSLLELPAGTLYYFCDIHGQGNKFFHIVNNKAGAIKRKIDEVLPELTQEETISLLKICYYPKAVLARKYGKKSTPLPTAEQHILHISKLIRHLGSKTTREQFYTEINRSIFSATIQELVTGSNEDKIGHTEKQYQKKIIAEYFTAGIHVDLICEMVRILKELLVHKYIINGDIPDRGPDTAAILDYLCTDPHAEINWGNHDLLWMGAAAGSKELIAEMIRIQLRYCHDHILEKDYRIDLSKLHKFATNTYIKAPAAGFSAQGDLSEKSSYSKEDLARMQKAISVILWKIEAARYQELGTTPHICNIAKNDNGELEVLIKEKKHPLLDQDFPTLDLSNPAQLTKREKKLLSQLCNSVQHSDRFQHHMRFLAERGRLYRVEDGILSFHAIVPVTQQGELKPITILGLPYKGRKLFDTLTSLYKKSLTMNNPPQYLLDLFYTGWKGAYSWTFGKSGMETFTRALVADKTTHLEKKSPYYSLLNDPIKGPELATTIIKDFSRGKTGSKIKKIFNGHIPIKLEKAESPVRANGNVICGDGGFSEAYGDIGFILIATSRGIYLSKLGKGLTLQDILSDNKDIVPEVIWQERFPERKKLRDCNIAPDIGRQIRRLRKLLNEYKGKK